MKKRCLYFQVFLVGWLTVVMPIKGANNKNKDITSKEIYHHIAFLASDELKGRKAGSHEANIAADYIRNQFSSYGLTLLGDQGLQTFDVLSAIEPGDENTFKVDQFSGKLFYDFVPINFSANGTLTSSCAFVGYGFEFESDSISWHDYANVDVTDKWVMILRDAPEAIADKDYIQPHRSLRKKAMVAKDKGAAGVIFVSGESFDAEDRLISLRDDPSTATSDMLVIHITRKIADLILQKSGFTIASLEKTINDHQKPQSFLINESIHATVQLHVRFSPTHNVVAMLPGSDRRLRNEYILLGAHYDHLGMGGPGSGSRRPDTMAVHNGADDNASGVAALLEIAQKLAAEKGQLRRSILFVAFTAEEMGTLGSRHFADHPPVELKNIQLVINMDMIGRFNDSTRAFTLGGTGTALGMEQILKDFAAKHELNPIFNPEGYGPSDHAVFYNRDIPVLFFMTSMHDAYHTPFDDVEFINVEGEKVLAEYIYSLLCEFANRPERLVFQEAGPKSAPPMGRRFKVTLGIMPDFVGSGVKGVRAEAVMPGRPAARAGMQKGDIIVAMEGKAIHDIYEYMNRLSDFRAGQRISIEVLRNGEKHILIVEL